MNVLRVGLLLLLAQAGVLEQPVAVSGVVVDRGSNLPISGAVVALSRGPFTVSETATTAADGTFVFRSVTPESYIITATRAGYVRSEVSGRIPGLIGPPPVRFVMTPTATISGRVLREDGRPAATVSVSVLRRGHTDGSRPFDPVNHVTTDATGSYVISELPPGQYFVGAVEAVVAPSIRQFVFAPGVTDVSNASLVELRAGQKLDGTDIRIGPALGRRVRGVVLDPSGRPATSGGVFLGSTSGWPDSNQAHSPISPSDGSFDFPRVPPGSYSLMAVLGDPEKRPLSGRARLIPIEVGNSDLADLKIEITNGVDIPGSVVLDGPARPGIDNSDPGRIIAALATASRGRSDPVFLFSAPPYIVFASQGTMDPAVPQSVSRAFTMKGVQPGDYELILSGLYCCATVSILLPSGLAPPYREPLQKPDPLRGVYVKSIRLAGVEVPSGQIRIDKSPAPLEIVLGTNPATLEVRALNELGQPAGDVTVVVIPLVLRQRMDLYHYGPTYASGGFRFELAPGDYKAYAFRGVTPGIWMEPAFMRLYEERGKLLRVEEGGRVSFDLPIIDLPH
jgi:hypothetical protein